MANIRVTCPACKSELEIDSAFEGQEVECGNCLEVFKANVPGKSGTGTGKIPGAGTSGAGRSGSSGSGSSGRSKPAPKKKRRDDDDDYEHDKRRDEYEDDEDDYAPPPPRRAAGDGDGAATASLVLGIVALVLACCCWPISFPAAIAGFVTGLVGLKSQTNKGSAVGGLVLSVIALGLAAVILLAGFGNAVFNQGQFR
jgi:predicted Zn finger-like uncharacterized protein